jgi:hypothetical protein
MRMFELAAIAAALTLAGAAHAQVSGNPAPSAPPPPPEIRGPDTRDAEFNRMRSEVADRAAGPTRSLRPVPVSPEDVTPGSDVRDSKGVVIGSIERVGMGFAVIVSPGGKIEVEFASLAKNNKGLLINMPKAKFDAIVAGSRKPAN